MTALFDYLLQASVILALFYAIYFLILRNERFFVEIRIYLVVSIILSLLLPFVKIPYTVIVESVQSSVQTELMPMFSGAMEAAPMKQNYFTVSNLLLAGYLFVVAVLLIRSLIKISQIYRMVLGKDYTVVEDCKVIVLDRAIPAFTFFGYIVMNREEFTDESRTNILAHEKVHAEQKHWIDLLLVELLTILVWFNPIVWLYQIAIKQTHELLADDGVIARGFNIGQYQATLINQIMGTEVLGLANNFNHSITKKRMIMMSNVKSPKNRRYKLLIVIPAVFAILLFNMKIVEVQAQEKKIKEVVNVMTVSGQILNVANEPIPGIALIVQNTKVGTISDMEGKFSIKIPSDGKLAFSGVDTEKVIISAAYFMENGTKTSNGYNMNVNLIYSIVKDVKEEKSYKGEPIFVIVEDMPEFPGGALKLKEFYEAKVSKLDKGYIIKKRCFITFLVTKTGEVADARVVRGTGNKKVDAKALEIVMSSPKWKPGKQRGKEVHVSYTVPVNFGAEKGRSKSKKYTIDPNTKDSIYFFVDEMPIFPGGAKALQNYITESVVYPSNAFVNGIRGKVFVTFIVNKLGDVDKVRVVRGVEATLDAEALRVVKSLPKWTPGIEKGKAVDVAYTVPITFGFTDDKKVDEVKVDGKNKMDGTAPKFPGGDLELRKFIAQAVKYPKEAQKKGETGKVFVTFVVDKLGSVDSVRIARGVSPLLDSEAIRVIKTLPNWIPGTKDGKSVNTAYTIPINFDLKDDESKNEKNNGEKVFVIVEKMPRFPGGAKALQEYIADNVKYPKEALKNGTKGKVYITFEVNKEGSVDNAKVARGVESSLDAEALRVINSLPKWTPGMEKGKPVNVLYTVPINFDLKEDKKK